MTLHEARIRDEPQLAGLAEEQAALRRVATTVAGGAEPAAIFACATEEIGRLFDSDSAGMLRYDVEAGTAEMVGRWESGDRRRLRCRHGGLAGGRHDDRSRLPRSAAGPTALGRRGRAARRGHARRRLHGDRRLADRGRGPALGRGLGRLGAPRGRTAGRRRVEAGGILPSSSRSGSRAPTHASVCSTRARGSSRQQTQRGSGLPATCTTARSSDSSRSASSFHSAMQSLDTDSARTAELLQASRVALDEANAELRELARGIHPVALTEQGLASALRALVRRSSLPAEVVAGARRAATQARSRSPPTTSSRRR